MGISDLPIRGLPPIDLPVSAGVAGGERLGKLSSRDDQALRQAAKDFESVLLHKLMDEMKNTIPDSGLTGGGATKQLQGIFWAYLARDVANKGGTGLWKDLYRQWSQAAASTSGAEPAAKESSV